MNCPCEVLVDSSDATLAESLRHAAQQEAARIENQFSRYKPDNVVARINAARGKPIHVDEETSALLDYAAHCYELSEGLFDITTGVLRRAWRFEGETITLNENALAQARQHVGWNRVKWKCPTLTLPDGFEVDLGGLCKEYAADRIVKLLKEKTDRSILVNLGGDIASLGSHEWAVGIEDPRSPGKIGLTVALRSGGIATSGSNRRFARMNGRTYSHILNPRTGWPVVDAPLSVTVTAATCTEAGLWTTWAMLQGRDAESFLNHQKLQFWCFRV